MEMINNENTKKLSKAIAQYCLRVFVFLVLRKLFLTDIFISSAYNYIVYPLVKDMEPVSDFFMAALLLTIVYFIVCYISAKITGIFKKLDGLNFFVALFIVFLIDVLLNCLIIIKIQFIPFKIRLAESPMMFFAPWAFLVYRVLGFLTKIFPMPFEKIGYIFSIEFVRDVIKKIWMNYGKSSK